MIRNGKNQSILTQYFSNYVVVVLLISLMTLSVGVFFVTQQQEQRETESNRLRINQIQLVMDSRLEQCLNITGKIAANRVFLAQNNLLTQPSRETMQELQKYFQTDVASDLLLIYGDERVSFFYSPVGSMALSGFDPFYQMESLPVLTLREYANTLVSPMLVQTKCYRSRTPYLVYLVPLEMLSANMNTLAVFLMPEAQVRSLCSTPFDNAEHVLLMTNALKPSIVMDGNPSQEEIDLLAQSTESVVQMGGGKIAYGAESRLSGYRYWVILSGVSAALSTLMNMLLVGVSVLLVGILLAYRMARRSYRPLSGIMKQLNLPTTMGNEFESIRDFVTMLQEDRTRHEKENRMVESHVYSLLLTGGYAAMESEELLELLRLPTDTTECALLLLHPAGALSSKTAALLKRDRGWGRAVSFDLQGDTFILLAAREHEPFAAACEALLKTLGDTEPNRRIIASKPFADILDAQSVLYQLRYGLRYQYIRRDRVIRLEELPQASQPDLECNLMFLSLYQYLLDKYLDLAREQGDKILQYLRDRFTPELQTLILWNFAAALNNYNRERLDSGELLSLCNQLLETTSLEKTQAVLKQIFDYIAQQNSRNGSSLSPETVRSCVEQHYTDASFSLQMLADTFGVSSPTISRYIKSCFGCTLTEYLTTLRIEKAKELLTFSNVPINQIVSLTGYNDVNNFYRRFRSVVGTTPSAFRVANQKNGEKDA